MGHGIDETSETLVDVLQRRAASMGDTIAYTFLRDGEGDAIHLTYKALATRAAAIATRLRDVDAPGARALLVYGAGPDFIEAFFGCLYAGMVAVPVMPPDPFNSDASARRIAAVAEDSGAACLLSSGALAVNADMLGGFMPALRQRLWIATDDLADTEELTLSHPIARTSQDLALLQYTSGSTGAPKGVMLSHANLLAHGRTCHRTLGLGDEEVVLSWLPLYHDMGLIGTVLYPLQAGYRSIQMSSGAFLRRPYRWLKAISDHRATLSVAPNFGYELCCRKISHEEIEELDLHGWTAALNGSERVQADTIERFARIFEPVGFRRDAFLPCYGLAEASLMVTAGSRGGRLTNVRLESRALQCNSVTVAGDLEASTTLVASGAVTDGQQVLIVDPTTGVPADPDQIGEIWVSGPCVAQGYWRRPEENAGTFGARPARGATASYLRTGDLGFFHEEQLIVVGRLKDLIIVRGVNHVPEDIERTVAQGQHDLRPGSGAAFAVEAGDGERLVVVHELSNDDVDTSAIVHHIRTAVAAAHGVHVETIALVRARTIPKTSSGKVRRRECRDRFVRGTLDVVAEWRGTGLTPIARDGRYREIPEDRDRLAAVRRIQNWLIVQVAALRDLPSDKIDVEAKFSTYGMDSAEAAILAVDLEDWLRTPLPSQLVWNQPTIAGLADALADLLPVSGAPSAPIA